MKSEEKKLQASSIQMIRPRWQTNKTSKNNTLQEKIRSTNRTCKISNRSRKWTNSRWKYPNICTICGNMDKRLCIKRTSTITYYRYKRMLETRITLYFGHYKLNKIKPTDIMRFYDLLEEDTQIIRRKNNNGKKTRKPLSQKTILEHHRLLSAMLHRTVY